MPAETRRPGSDDACVAVTPPPAAWSPLDQAAAFAEIALNLRSRRSLQQTLDEVVGTAVAVLEGCEFAGVLLVGPGRRLSSGAGSTAAVRACNNAQVATRDGPCLTAATDGKPVRVDDLRREERWPRFVVTATRLGMESMLSLPLATAEHRIGALNLYATRPAAFGEAAQEVASVFAIHAAVAIGSARLEEQLRGALESRGQIGRAVGIVMARNGLAPIPAFELLKLASQHRNLRLRNLAEEVVTGRLDPTDLLRARPE